MVHLSWRARPSGSRLWLVLALLGSLGLGGCMPAYEARLAHLRDRGDLAAADRLLAGAEARNPDDPAILRERGVLAFERGDAESAIRLLERSLALAPEDVRAALYIAAASDRAGRWHEAAARYPRAQGLGGRSPALATALTCQRQAVEARRLTAMVEARLEAELASALKPGQRVLILPLAEQSGSSVGRSLRLGLAAILTADWARAPVPEAVPLDELLAFLDALEVPLDAPISRELRDRLVLLTGARYVLDGQLSELNDVVSVAPVLTDREAPPGSQEKRLEYQQSRVGTLLELEKTLLFHMTDALDIALTPERQRALGIFASQSGLAVVLYGEALRLERAGDREAAGERLERAIGLDPGFRLAREARLALGGCHATAGEPERLVRIYEAVRWAEGEARVQRELLAATTGEASRVGGPDGEGKDLSLNRPGGSGTVTIPVRLPR